MCGNSSVEGGWKYGWLRYPASNRKKVYKGDVYSCNIEYAYILQVLKTKLIDSLFCLSVEIFCKSCMCVCTSGLVRLAAMRCLTPSSKSDLQFETYLTVIVDLYR